MTTITWVFRTLVVPAGIVAAARELGAALTPAGAGMFTTPCSPTGTGDATHYISSGMLDAQFAGLLADVAGLYAAAQAAAKAQGLTLTATLADCTALLTTGDISEDQPFVALGRLGLQLIQSSEALT